MVGVSCVFALLVSACAKNDATVSRLEGSEPQRLSFGAPASVQDIFTKQMKACWFDGPSALLAGYQYDTKPAILETAEGLTELRQVTIQSGREPEAQRFVIQFYPFNNNTLISTRNLSFPVDLAARLKRDVETWVFGGNGCQMPAGSIASSDVAPQTSSSSLQQTASGGWATNQEPKSPLSNRY